MLCLPTVGIFLLGCRNCDAKEEGAKEAIYRSRTLHARFDSIRARGAFFWVGGNTLGGTSTSSARHRPK